MLNFLKKWFGKPSKEASIPATREMDALSVEEKLSIAISAKTDVGCVRTSNEDHFYYDQKGAPSDKGFLAMVADGMGGHAAGEVASQLATEVISTEFHGAKKKTINKALFEAFVLANSEIYDQAQANSVQKGMGTTCTALVIENNQLQFAHVGDSRLYRLRSGQIQQLSNDHTWVQEMVRQGNLTPEEAEKHEDKHMLTQAMGTKPKVDVEITENSIFAQSSDRYLLSSDGFHDQVSKKEIKELMSVSPLDKATAAMVKLARERGGPDNITVVLIELQNEVTKEESTALKTKEIQIDRTP